MIFGGIVMKKNREIFEDISKLTGSAFSGMVGMKNEMKKTFAKQIEIWGKTMQFVHYDEFHALKKLASETKMELDALKKHLGIELKEKPVKSKATKTSAAKTKKSAAAKPAKSSKAKNEKTGE